MDEPALETVHQIPLEALTPASDNPRREMRELEDLAASIREHGILQPLLVRRQGSGLQIVCGERRWRAARMAGLGVVPCLIRAMTERERLERMVVENVQRRSLDPIEEAQAYRRLLDQGWSQGEIAQKVGKSQGYVSRKLGLLYLPKATQRQVSAGKIGQTAALGYENVGPRDIFEADEQLSIAWRALRREMLDSGDRVIIAALREFARAYKARLEAAKQPVSAEAEGVA